MGAFDEWEELHQVTVMTPGAPDEYGHRPISTTVITGMLELGDVNVIAANGSEVVSTARLHTSLDHEPLLVPGATVVTSGPTVHTVLSRTWVQIGDPDLDGVTANLA